MRRFRHITAAVAGMAVLVVMSATAGAYTRPSVPMTNLSVSPDALALAPSTSSPNGASLFITRTGSGSTPTLSRLFLNDFSNAVPIDIISASTPAGVASTVQGRAVMVAADGSITTVFPSTGAPVAGGPINTGASSARAVAAAPGVGYPGRIYVLNGPTASAGSLIALNTSNDTTSTVTAALPAQARALAIEPTGLHALVAHTFDATLKRVLLADGTITSLSLAGGAGGVDVVIDAAGAFAYVAGIDGVITRVRLSDFTVAGSSTDLGDGELRAITLSADEQHVFASFQGAGSGASSFIALDATTLTVARTLELPTGSNPGSIAATNGYAFVALPSAGLGSITRIELKPDAPTNLSATAGDASARVAFEVNDSQLRNVEYSLDGGPWVARSPVAATSPITISGLTNGRQYAIQLRVVDGLATSVETAAVTVTPVATAAVTVTPVTPTRDAGNALRTRKPTVRGNTIVTVFSATGPGTATQNGTIVLATRAGRARTVRACSTTLRVQKAGTVTLTCRLTKQARAMRRSGAIRVLLKTTFSPAAGAKATGEQVVSLKRA
jgi:hypothetical protein